MSVPVGDAMIGRVVNALGQPIDDKGPIHTKESLPIERLAPGVIDRQPVHEPMATGLKAIDSMIPIGRGQRELIIGDRQTGKTAIALDTIINSKGRDLICVYCAIGQKRSSVAQVVKTLDDAARWNTPSSSSRRRPSRRRCSISRLTPPARMGEYFRDKGKRTRCSSMTIFPSTPWPIARCRCCCAVLRDAKRIPATCFYLHSRLLERAAKLSDAHGGGLADCAADYRNAGGRRLGVHSDERHFDHRRPDISGNRSVQLRRPSRGKRGAVGQPRRLATRRSRP